MQFINYNTILSNLNFFSK